MTFSSVEQEVITCFFLPYNESQWGPKLCSVQKKVSHAGLEMT